jgi:hypothetical protein
VRQRARLGAEAPHAAHPGAGQRDGEVGARRAGDLHHPRALEQAHGVAHRGFIFGVGRRAFQDLGVFVADHQHAGAALKDLRQFHRVLQAFDRAVGDEGAAGQRCHHRLQPADGVGRAGAAHRHRCGLLRCGQHHMEPARAQPGQRQFAQLHQTLPRLGFRQHRAGVAGLHATQAEHLDEAVDPLGFDALRQAHNTSPSIR